MWYRCFFHNTETGLNFHRDIEDPDFNALRGTLNPTFLYSDQLPGKPYGPKELYDFFTFPGTTDASIAVSAPESLLFEIKEQVGYANYWELFPAKPDGLDVDYMAIAMQIKEEARKRTNPGKGPDVIIADLLSAIEIFEGTWQAVYCISDEDKIDIPTIVQVAIENAKNYLKELEA